MKRFILPMIVTALLALSASATTNPPPTVLEGWQVFGPSGGTPNIFTGSVSFVEQESLTPDEVNQMLSVAVPSAALAAVSFNIGLSTNLPAASNAAIAELARALDYNWLLCYAFVRDNIKHTPYAGIVRGPLRTLIDREGNSADQAFLLLALLRASGYTCTIFFDPYFHIPYADAANGYDAASWLGVSSAGSVADIKQRLYDILESLKLYPYFFSAATPETSYVYMDHYFVLVYLPNDSYKFLDPSFKPRDQTAPSASILNDMGYSRSNLLAAAGGDYTNNWFVQGLSTSGLTNELCELTANLADSLNEITTRGFIGYDDINPQDYSKDTNYFHGYYNSPIDFLAQSNAVKSRNRTQLTVIHGGITNNCWIDELAGRDLWISYTNAPGYSYPKAVLRLDDSILATEDFGSDGENVAAAVGVYHQSIKKWVFDSYALKRSVTNVYSIPVGFGSATHLGMREKAVQSIAGLRGEGEHENSIVMRSAVLNSLGHQWLYQCAMLDSLLSRLGGYRHYTLFETGIVGQEASSFFDFKTGADFISSATVSALYGGKIFTSALEHGVLDQNNGKDRPAVSTVRVIDLANTDDVPIYLTSSNNWQSIRPLLTNYSPERLDWMADWIASGQKYLLPEDGLITLNEWSGYGFFTYGPKGTGSLLGGGLGGGSTTLPWLTDPYKVIMSEPRVLYPDTTVPPVFGADPVDMRSGAAVISRADLGLAGPSPLLWKRRYDSRQRRYAGSAGRGWSHAYDSHVTLHADPDAFMGRGLPVACAASVVACLVVDDLMKEESARNLTAACLVAKWWTDQLYDSAATVITDGSALSYTRLPDGSYEPSPGVTASLTGNPNNGFTLQERFGRSWNFATNGVLAYVEDRSGNRIGFTYSNQTALVSVTNSFGSELDITWSDGKISSVSDNAGRSVAYTYTPDGCLTGVTDTAGYLWQFAYNSEGAFISETDPAGVITVQNSYNTLGQVTNQLSASGNHWVFAFADGWRSWEADPFLKRTHHGFTPEGRNSWRQDRDGAFHQFFYDSCGHLVTNIDAIGRIHISAYDSDNHLLSVTEAANTPDARTTSFAYDAQHHLIATTNALGRITRMSYDSHDRLALLTTPDGVSVTNTYNAKGLLTTSRTLDSGGQALRESSFVYNSRGLPEERTSTDAGTTAFSYDSAGNVTGVTDALGNATTFTYDPRGFSTNAINALGHSATTLFNATGRPVTATDPLGRTTAFQWTPGGKPAAVIFPDGGVLTNSYDIADRLVSVTDTRNATLAFNLDVAGRVTNRIASTWSDYTWYDAAGVVTTLQDAVSGRTRITSDWLDRPVAVTDPLSHTHYTYYDPLNSVTNTVDPRGRSARFTYDIMGRLSRTTRPSGYAESYGHDALGRTTSFTNAEGRVTTQTFDAQNRLLSTVNAAGERLFLNCYDNLGNLTNRLDGADNSTAYVYDALNRNTSVTYTDDSSDTFVYDAANNLTGADNGSVSNSFVYDNMNRLVAAEVKDLTSEISFQTAYAYDLGGLVTNIVYPGNKTLRYGYDTDGRLTSVTDWNNRTYTFVHDAAGRRTSLTYPNGVSGAYSYDASHALTSWSFTKSGSILTGRTINRDAAGIKTDEAVTAGLFPNPTQQRRAFNTFDAADRLTSAIVHSGTNTFNESYRYNANGSLTNLQSTVYSSQSTVLSHQAAYSYDIAGRFTGYNSQFSTLNYQFTISYDALGNRAKTVQDGKTRLWVTDHADPLKRPLMETDSSGTPVRYYIWGGGMLLAIIEADGTVHYAHSDELGSIVALTDSSGTVTDQFCYGPYGSDWGHSGINSIPFRWLGSHGVFAVATPNPSNSLTPSPCLYLTRYRAYDAYTGRFLSSDPLGLGGGPNLYAYCLGNPLSYIDPLGLCGESYGFGFDDYLSDVGQIFMGYGDAGVNTVKGLYQLVTQPQNVVLALIHPSQTWNGVTADYSGRWNEGYRGQGSIIGEALITIATIGAGFADDAGNVGRIASAVNKVDNALPDEITPVAQNLLNSGPIPKSLGAGSRAEMLARKFKLNVNSPTSRQVLNSLDDSVSNFVSKYRKGGILRELPGEVMDMSVGEALGTSTKVRKLLIDGRFAK